VLGLVVIPNPALSVLLVGLVIVPYPWGLLWTGPSRHAMDQGNVLGWDDSTEDERMDNSAKSEMDPEAAGLPMDGYGFFFT